MSAPLPDHAPAAADRARWMSVLARAPADELARRAAALPTDTLWLRRPETGLVMVRGRTGGTGVQFNVGEMAVTRCALRLADGTVGHAYIAGRDADHAKRAAVIDALMQKAAGCGQLAAAWQDWIAPLDAVLTQRRAEVAGRAVATRVEFFTVVRGENA